MKLIRSQKNNEPKKQTEELYPKVKTFSRAYSQSHSAQETPSAQNRPIRAFRPDERPYLVTDIPADVPVVPLSVETDSPERIDLQDTLLTDESFSERFPESHSSASAVPAVNAVISDSEPEKPAVPQSPAEPEMPVWNSERKSSPVFTEEKKADIPGEPAGSEKESWYGETENLSVTAGAEEDDDPDPFYVSESENEYESGPLFDAGPGYGTEPPLTGPDSETDEEPESFFVDESEEENLPKPPLWSDDSAEPEYGSGDEEELQENGSETESGSMEQLFPCLETKGKTSLTATWQPLPDADGYDLYFARSGESFDGIYRTLSPEETAFTFTDLDKKTVYKMRVVAFDQACGQKTVICESETVRSITGGSTKKHTNAEKIKIRESALELSVDEKKKISASVTGQDEDRQVLARGGVLHYLSEDTSVATVSGEGKVSGVAPGRCRVYAIAANGLRSAVDVTVQEKPAAVAFRKKKYPLEVGGSINLRKKLVSKPDKETGSLKWKSSDKEIARISKKGILTALKKGQITVRVKTPEAGSAKVRIRITSPKKAKTVPWSGIGTVKKSSSGKKWSYLA